MATPNDGPSQEEDEWVPLEAPSTTTSNKQDDEAIMEEVNTPGITSAEIVANNRIAVVPPLSSSSSSYSSSNKKNNRPGTIQTLQRRVAMRQRLQQRLIRHPLHILWSHFLWHLAREFWNLDVKIRVAVLLMCLGAQCKMLCWMTWYLWYPKTIVVACLLVGSWIYLNAHDLPRRIQRGVDSIVNIPNRIPETLERLNPKQIRYLCLVGLFTPTVLQMRTISFLAGLNATRGGFLWNIFITVCMVAIATVYLVPHPAKSERDIFQLCLLVLYASALWITFVNFDILTMPHLAAPFFLSTGTLLLAYDDHHNMEWFSELVRYSLRLTLRDILASVGDSVQEDELLQLAMLRWIVDYWSYTPPQPQQSTTEQPSQHPSQQSTSESTTNPAPPTSTPANNATLEQQELELNDLLPMLNLATDQMSNEVHSLQHPQSQSDETRPAATSSTQAGTGAVPASTTNSNSAKDPLLGLHAMLASMNIDDRAKPAVAAYKRNVEHFPPSRDLALSVAIIRRCPACLTLLWHISAASVSQSFTTSLRIFLLLLPLVGLEMMRIRAWAVACEALSRLLEDGKDASLHLQDTNEAPPTSFLPYAKFLSFVDPMTILLSGDDDTIVSKVQSETNATSGVTSITAQVKIPSLLIVWRNIQSSVKALEVSLSAARCAQTGVVAVEFAKNIMSLAHFGSEVSRHGWMHGLTVIAKEVIFTHQGDLRRAACGSHATFTSAAVSAVHNGQVVARNLQVLSTEDENINHIIGPIASLFGFVSDFFHRGGDNEEHRNEASTTTNEVTPEEPAPQNTNTHDNNESGRKKTISPEKPDALQEVIKPMSKSEEVALSNLEESVEKKPNNWDVLPQPQAAMALTKVVAATDVVTTVELNKISTKEANVDPFKAPLVKPEEATSAGDRTLQKDAGESVAAQSAAEWEATAAASKLSPSTSPVDPPRKAGDDEKKPKSVPLDREATATAEDISDDLAMVMELICDAFELRLIDKVSSQRCSFTNAPCASLTFVFFITLLFNNVDGKE